MYHESASIACLKNTFARSGKGMHGLSLSLRTTAKESGAKNAINNPSSRHSETTEPTRRVQIEISRGTRKILSINKYTQLWHDGDESTVDVELLTCSLLDLGRPWGPRRLSFLARFGAPLRGMCGPCSPNACSSLCSASAVASARLRWGGGWPTSAAVSTQVPGRPRLAVGIGTRSRYRPKTASSSL